MEFKTLLAFMAVASFLVMLITISSGSPDSISFNFQSFDPNHRRINFEGDAALSNHSIRLTANQRDQKLDYSAGWATYFEPMHLWDKSTGAAADFSTRFYFSTRKSVTYADGIAFFLVPNGTKMPEFSKGGFFALPISNFSSSNRINTACIAVEFDTSSNTWDPRHDESQPNGAHIGLNINSARSVVTDPWELKRITIGGLAQALITYSSSSGNLSVRLVDESDPVGLDDENISSLSYKVYLSNILPEWVTFGFSGSTTGQNFELHRIISWEFNSTLGIPDPVGKSQVMAPVQAMSPLPMEDEGTKNGLTVGMSVGGSVLAIVLLGFFWFYWCRRRKGKGASEDRDGILQHMSGALEMESTGPKKFSYSELASATRNFKASEKLGEGGFGGVYKGFLQSTNSHVAVKKISSESKQGVKEYASEIKIISRLRHRNLVQLIGWCHEKKELLLVYEFMPEGSLDFHLFKGKSFIPWNTRYRIAQGLASALLYLHEECEQCVVHRDIKSSNIMLDSEFNTKLGDFGLARLVDHAKGSQTTSLAGTMGYMAPEYVQTFRSTKESDVYSFGMVCLEIACGRRPVELSRSEDQEVMIEWLWRLHKKGLISQAADPKLGDDFNRREMERLLIIGLSCTLTDSRLRPSARQALRMLEPETPLPVLPSENPLGIATYFSLLDEEPETFLSGSTTTGTSNQTTKRVETNSEILEDSGVWSYVI